jgi:hypothetical protein
MNNLIYIRDDSDLYSLQLLDYIYKGIDGMKLLSENWIDIDADYNRLYLDRINRNSLLHINHVYDTMRYLLNKGCHVNYVNQWQMNALYYQTSYPVIRLLLEYGLEPEITCINHVSYLIGNKDMDSVKYIIEELNENPFIWSDTSYTPSDYKINEYYNPFLISLGLDIYDMDLYDINEGIYLNGIMFINDINILKYVFNHPKFKDNLKNYINLTNNKNTNLLFYIKDPVIFEYLLKCGCNPYIITVDGCNLLQFHTDIRLIKLLLKYMRGNIEYMDSVCEWHLDLNHINLYVYLNRYRHCLIIQIAWREYINNKKYVPPDNIDKKINFQFQLKYMPPYENHNHIFNGGIEYQKSLIHYRSLISD